jgi:hypothetical protein
MYSGILIFIAGFFVSYNHEYHEYIVFIVSLLGLALLIIGSVYAWWVISCPKCKGSLGPLIMWLPFFSISERIQFCPYCGVDIDSKLNE